MWIIEEDGVFNSATFQFGISFFVKLQIVSLSNTNPFWQAAEVLFCKPEERYLFVCVQVACYVLQMIFLCQKQHSDLYLKFFLPFNAVNHVPLT